MKRALVLGVLAAAACLDVDPQRPRAPRSPPIARVETAIARWASALETGDDEALERAEDGYGQFAIVYGAIKTAGSHVPDGAEAVETTMGGLIVVSLLQLWAPGLFGAPFQTWYAVVPTGPLGPAFVAAGLAAPRDPADGTPFVIVPLPWEQTFGRVTAARQKHRDTLRRRAAWTCRPTAIEHTLPARDPRVVDAAVLSTWIVDHWVRAIDNLWLVRARCADGPALFVVTGYLDGDDRVLLATGPRP